MIIFNMVCHHNISRFGLDRFSFKDTQIISYNLGFETRFEKIRKIENKFSRIFTFYLSKLSLQIFSLLPSIIHCYTFGI